MESRADPSFSHNQSLPLAECQRKKPKRNRNAETSSPSTPESINLAEDDDSHDTYVQMERPIGRKAEKERLKKAKSNDRMSSPIVELLIEMNEERKRTEKKLELLEKLYHVEAEKARMEQLKEEERIMLIDTSGMSPMGQDYYHLRQMEIIESRRKSN